MKGKLETRGILFDDGGLYAVLGEFLDAGIEGVGKALRRRVLRMRPYELITLIRELRRMRAEAKRAGEYVATSTSEHPPDP